MTSTSPNEDVSSIPSPPESPVSLDSPTSPSESLSAPPQSAVDTRLNVLEPPRLSPRSISASATTSGMTTSSTPLGSINAARRPAPRPPTISSRDSGLNVSQDIMARIKAVHLGRQGAPPQTNPLAQQGVKCPPGPGNPHGVNRFQGGAIAGSPVQVASPGGQLPGGVPANFRMPRGMSKPPAVQSHASAPAVARVPTKPSLAEKRGLKLPGGLPDAQPNGTPPAGGRKKPGLKLSDMGGNAGSADKPADNAQGSGAGTMMDKYAEFLDPKTGSLRFKGKAILNSEGVKFSSGTSFSISLDEVDTLDELGKGNYGTVYKVRHSRPKIRRPGQGLGGNKPKDVPGSPDRRSLDAEDSSPTSGKVSSNTSGVVMAMKEIRLELDDAKFAAIIMELDILHRCVSPFIVDFYGAFFQEGAVYICMEFMDGGSIDKLYGDGIPEPVLRKITLATTMGLKSLKEDHNIIHRDVKPTNILMNTRGQVKICDFGVSGNLVASIAKTNIGCQSYMAPERISSGGIAQAGASPGGGTYSVQSDIWSLGLTIIECALGRYPYPPETYNNIFSQLSAIVNGDPPDLPEDHFSPEACDFVRRCLDKIPHARPTYPMLLQHPWLAPLLKPPTISEEEEDGELSAPSDAEDAESTESDISKTSIYSYSDIPPQVYDEEVAKWVTEALEKRRKGLLGNKEKPALHAAPLDAVGSPLEVNGI